MFKSYAQESRSNWGCNDRQPSTDELKLGCLQRIADATELAAKNHAALVAERDRLARYREDDRKCIARLVRSNNALRGVIKRMKKANGNV